MLEAVDLDAALSKEEYQRVFPPLEERLRRLQYALLEAEIPTVVAFEGWDAAGKGTIIQRLTRKLDPRAFQAFPGRRPPSSSSATTSSGATRPACPKTATWPCSTTPGTGACSWTGSRSG